jgi:hypothetical protein
MVNESYKPVRIDIKKSITKAKLRPGFTQAWNSLDEEYAALEVLLSARKMAAGSIPNHIHELSSSVAF